MIATAAAAVRRLYDLARRRCRTLAAVRVVDYLYWCSCRFGRATPSRAQIAAATGYCERTVTRAVAELELTGTLKVWRDTPHRRDDGTFTRARTNLYRLKWPPRAVNALVAPRGHGMHVKAPSRALEPAGPPASPPPVLFEAPPDTAEAPLDEPEVPVAPTFVRLGLTYDEWRAAGYPDAPR